MTTPTTTRTPILLRTTLSERRVYELQPRVRLYLTLEQESSPSPQDPTGELHPGPVRLSHANCHALPSAEQMLAHWEPLRDHPATFAEGWARLEVALTMLCEVLHD